MLVLLAGFMAGLVVGTISQSTADERAMQTIDSLRTVLDSEPLFPEIPSSEPPPSFSFTVIT